MELPAGTVTFLFTDIEGSTRLWEEQPEDMKTALARHDALLLQAVDKNGGSVVKTTGDGMLAVFPTAYRAVQAATDGQHLLNGENWDVTIGQIRARMGIHTGTADERDGDYFGRAPNRAARLMACGHGGQILLSQTTEALVRDDLHSVGHICRLLEGLPLGILLAAAWSDMLSPDEIAREIARGLDFLETEMRDMPGRHRSIREEAQELLIGLEKSLAPDALASARESGRTLSLSQAAALALGD